MQVDLTTNTVIDDDSPAVQEARLKAWMSHYLGVVGILSSIASIVLAICTGSKDLTMAFLVMSGIFCYTSYLMLDSAAKSLSEHDAAAIENAKLKELERAKIQ